MDGLDERKMKILDAIIRTYLETGEPVGSRTISKYTDLNLSSATIRNEMSDLEELGYIVQPHTSAGRIPSDKGYRFYGLSASAADDIRKYTEAHQVNYDYCSTDEIQLKTIVRSNPGLILLRQGTILDKWGHRDLPEVEELQNKDLASYCLQEQQAITDRYLIYSLIMLYIACIFLYIIRKYKRMIK